MAISLNLCLLTNTLLSPATAERSVQIAQIGNTVDLALQREPAATADTVDLAADPAERAVQIAQSSNSPRLSAESSVAGQIDDITKQIIRDLIKLERYNIDYRLASAQQGRFKGWRYFLSQEGNNGCTEGALIISDQERTSHFRDGKKVNRRHIEYSNVTAIVGQVVGAIGSGFEFWINVYHDVDARSKGYSGSVAKTFVMGLRAEVNKLLAERDRLMQLEASDPTQQGHYQLALAEDKVLRDVRDLGLFEFSAFHMDVRRLLAFQQSLYVLDVVNKTTGAVSSLYGYLAQRYHHRHWNTNAGVYSLVSATALTTAPVVSRLIGLMVQKKNEHYLGDCTSDCRTSEVTTLQRHKAALDQLARQFAGEPDAVSAILKRTSAYETYTNSYLEQFELSGREIRSGNLAATENILSGFLVGSTKIVSGIQYTVAGSEFAHDPQVSNVLLGTGALTYTVGSTWALIDNLRIQVKRELVTRRLSAQNQLPQQILKTRLSQLDTIDMQL